MEIFGFEKDEDGNIFCNENGQKKQSFTAFSPYETIKVIFNMNAIWPFVKMPRLLFYTIQLTWIEIVALKLLDTKEPILQ